MGKQYSIHQVAELIGISADAIRLYEKEGLIHPGRREENGYRYYETEQIHRIMAVSLYRQLDVGLAEIQELLRKDNLGDICEEFERIRVKDEAEVVQLQNKIKKIKFMEKHLQMLQEGIDSCSVKELPPRYVLFQNKTGGIAYEEIKRVMRSPQFSYGNFCYHISRSADGKYVGDSLQFVIREPMLQISPHTAAEGMQYYPGYRCIYRVCAIPELSPVEWKLDGMYEYAEKEGVLCGSEAYAFYVYSVMKEEKMVDYYEIFLPILK